jgi:hypothetical protein
MDAGRTFAVLTPEFVVPYKCALTGIMAEMNSFAMAEARVSIVR